MDPSLSSITVVIAHVALTLMAGVLYLRRARVDRPPVGVFNGRDVLVVAGALVVIPPVYLSSPVPVLATVFALLSAALLYFSLSPVLGSRRSGRVAVALVVVDVALAEVVRADREWLFLLVNNTALAIVVVGVCNIWVQSGIQAHHVAFLACGLAVYDAIATLALPLMEDFLDRIASVPLTPVVAWGHGPGQVGIGMGDLLLVLVWTLVAEKAFSRRAGLVAALVGLSSIAALFLAFWIDLYNRPLPAMVVLGPLIGLHYLTLARRAVHQRTTAEYLATLEAGPEPAPSDLDQLDATNGDLALSGGDPLDPANRVLRPMPRRLSPSDPSRVGRRNSTSS